MIPVYTRFLSPSDYGALEIFTILSGFLIVFLSVGIAQALYRFYFEYEDTNQRNLVLSTTLITVIVISFLGISSLMLFSGSFSSLIFHDRSFTQLFLIAFSSLFFEIILSIYFDYLRIQQKSVLYLIISLIKLVIALSLNILFVVYFLMSVKGILLSNLITGAIMTLVLIPVLFYKTGIRYSVPIAREMLKFGLPLILSNIAGRLATVSDRFILNAFAGLSATGIYALGFKFGAMINTFVTSPFIQIWNARRFELFKRPDAEYIFSKIFTYFTIIITTIGLVMSLTIKEIIALVATPEYQEAYKIVPFIVLTYIIFSFHYHLNIGIFIKKKTHYLAFINVTNAILNIGLNIVLIKYYGIWGAVVTGLVSKLYKIILTYILSRRVYHLIIETRIIFILLIAVILYIPFHSIFVYNLYVTIILKGILGLSIPFILILVRFFDASELSAMKKIIFRTA
jgi:O-antigen/teichoic acid export membrane protein